MPRIKTKPHEDEAADIPTWREPQRARGRSRVNSILDTALAIFTEQGFGAATMSEISDRSKTSIGSLYRFFPTKESIADALVYRHSVRVEEHWKSIALRARDLSATGLADAFVDSALEARRDPNLAFVLADARGDPAARQRRNRLAVHALIVECLTAATGGDTRPEYVVMAPILLRLLEIVMAAADEKQTDDGQAVSEARAVVRLYLSHRLQSTG